MDWMTEDAWVDCLREGLLDWRKAVLNGSWFIYWLKEWWVGWIQEKGRVDASKAVVMHNFVSCLWLHWKLRLLLVVARYFLEWIHYFFNTHYCLSGLFRHCLLLFVTFVLSFKILVPAVSVKTLQAAAYSAPWFETRVFSVHLSEKCCIIFKDSVRTAQWTHWISVITRQAMYV